VGFGRAAQLVASEMAYYQTHVSRLRDSFESEVLSKIKDCYRNGASTCRLANTTNLSFVGVEAQALLMLLDREGIYASTGSACLADSPEPSHVISAMRKGKQVHRDYMRFSFGLLNSREDVDRAVMVLVDSVSMLRDLNSD
jgi:cysteine desulfurase